jgi:hypothetical protein
MTHDYKTQTVFFSHDPRNMVADVSVSRKGLCEGATRQRPVGRAQRATDHNSVFLSHPVFTFVLRLGFSTGLKNQRLTG